MFSLHKDTLSDVENVLVDGGYSGEPFANGVKNLLHCEVEVAKRNELHTFKVIPKRWVVERSFSWLEKCRRLWKNCERKLNTSLHMVILAFVVLFRETVLSELLNKINYHRAHREHRGRFYGLFSSSKRV